MNARPFLRRRRRPPRCRIKSSRDRARPTTKDLTNRRREEATGPHATVGDKLAKELIVNLRLNADVKVLKESIDREDLFFNDQSLHVSSATNFEDLRFLTSVVGSLPKVIIYSDSIALLIRIRESLTKFYREARGDSDPTRASRQIRCYNGPMSESAKTSIYEDFREVDSEIRILCATDAMGLVMNIIDVDIVIQWKQPPSIRALMQRAGRAARGAGRVGEFIWFHPVWCKGERAPPPPRRAGSSGLRLVISIDDVDDKTESETEIDEEKRANRAKKKQTGKKTLIEQRARLDDSLWRIVNESGCIRTMFLKAFDDPNIDDAPRHRYETGCCSRCSPNEGSTTRIHTRRCQPSHSWSSHSSSI